MSYEWVCNLRSIPTETHTHRYDELFKIIARYVFTSRLVFALLSSRKYFIAHVTYCEEQCWTFRLFSNVTLSSCETTSHYIATWSVLMYEYYSETISLYFTSYSEYFCSYSSDVSLSWYIFMLTLNRIPSVSTNVTRKNCVYVWSPLSLKNVLTISLEVSVCCWDLTWYVTRHANTRT